MKGEEKTNLGMLGLATACGYHSLSFPALLPSFPTFSDSSSPSRLAYLLKPPTPGQHTRMHPENNRSLGPSQSHQFRHAMHDRSPSLVLLFRIRPRHCRDLRGPPGCLRAPRTFAPGMPNATDCGERVNVGPEYEFKLNRTDHDSR